MRLGLGASAGAAAALVGACLSVGRPQGDFANYWTAASLWREGADLQRLVDYRWLADQAARLGLGDRLVGWPPLTPPSVLFLAPLLPLGLHRAELTWLVVQAGLALVVAWASARAARVPLWAGVLAVALGWPALRAHLAQGQLHLPAAALLALGLWAWRSERPVAMGACWALATGLKLFSWPLLLLLAAQRRWRALGAAGLVLALGATLSVALVGLPLHRQWLREVLPAVAGGWLQDPWHSGMSSLAAGLRHAWLPHPGLGDPVASAHPRWAVGVPAALGLLLPLLPAAAGLARGEDTTLRQGRLLAAAALAALVGAPVIARYSLVLLPPVVLLVSVEALRAGRQGLALSTAGAALLALAAPTVNTWPAHLPLLLGLPRFWALLLLYLVLLPRPGRSALVPLALALLVGLRARPPVPSGVDGAVPRDDPAFPLVASDLVQAPDGSLCFSGLTADRGGLPGHGWLGLCLAPGQVAPRRVAADPARHTWSPAVVEGQLRWSRGPTGAERPSPVPCRGGSLEEVEVDGQQDIAWRGPEGQQVRLTTHPGHDAWPVCDEKAGVAWFLSDRGVGLRALRLWSVALP